MIGGSAHSAGALRYVLPLLSSIGGELREGEIAYDADLRKVVVRTDDGLEVVGKETVYYDGESFPLITSNAYRNPSTFNPVRYSEISAGNVLIKGKIYKNSSDISCIHDLGSPITGFGNHDGSALPTHTIPAGMQYPLYLYLVADGAGFDCVYSYKATGPESSLIGTNGWLRAQSLVGAVAFGGGATYKTVKNRTFVRNSGGGSLELYINSGTNTANENVAIFVPSMKSVGFTGMTCTSTSHQILVNEKITLPYFTKSKNKSNAATVGYVKAGGCDGFTSSRGDAFEYIFQTSDRKIYTTSNVGIMISITGWTENQITSI